MHKFSHDLLREGDHIIVLSGKYKGQISIIKSFDRKRGRVIVDNINIMTSFSKDSGITKQEGWMNRCKVMFYDMENQCRARLGRDENRDRIIKIKGTIKKDTTIKETSKDRSKKENIIDMNNPQDKAGKNNSFKGSFSKTNKSKSNTSKTTTFTQRGGDK